MGERADRPGLASVLTPNSCRALGLGVAVNPMYVSQAGCSPLPHKTWCSSSVVELPWARCASSAMTAQGQTLNQCRSVVVCENSECDAGAHHGSHGTKFSRGSAPQATTGHRAEFCSADREERRRWGGGLGTV